MQPWLLLEQNLRQARILPLLADRLTGRTIWLVGGALRDVLLGRRPHDFDFATPFDPTELAQQFARDTAGSWFWLDRQRRQSRVVRKQPSGPLYYDFAPLRAPDLAGDLALRDFTCNAMAVPLNAQGVEQTWLDPLDGMGDLDRRHLVLCGDSVLADDPLRVLRGIRYAVQLDLTPSTSTLQQLTAAAAACRRMPAERIGQELVAIFSSADFSAAIDLLRRVTLFELAFGSRCTADRIRRGIQEVVAAQPVLPKLSHRLTGQPAAATGVDTALLLRLAIFCRGAGLRRPGEHFARAWALGKRPAACVDRLQALDASQWQSLAGLPAIPRARALWLEELGPFPVEALQLLCLLHPRDASGWHRARQALSDWQALQRNGRVPDLVSGRWLQRQLRLHSGPEIGRMLSDLRQAERRGEIRSVAEAQCWCRGKIVDKD